MSLDGALWSAILVRGAVDVVRYERTIQLLLRRIGWNATVKDRMALILKVNAFSEEQKICLVPLAIAFSEEQKICLVPLAIVNLSANSLPSSQVTLSWDEKRERTKAGLGFYIVIRSCKHFMYEYSNFCGVQMGPIVLPTSSDRLSLIIQRPIVWNFSSQYRSEGWYIRLERCLWSALSEVAYALLMIPWSIVWTFCFSLSSESRYIRLKRCLWSALLRSNLRASKFFCSPSSLMICSKRDQFCTRIPLMWYDSDLLAQKQDGVHLSPLGFFHLPYSPSNLIEVPEIARSPKWVLRSPFQAFAEHARRGACWIYIYTSYNTQR